MKDISSANIGVLGVCISAVNLDSAWKKIRQWIIGREKEYVCVAPVATVVDCQKDPFYRDIVNGAGMVTPDGMPLVWLGKRQGNQLIERTYGPDLMKKICRESVPEGFSHFFYGGTPAVLEDLIKKLTLLAPGLNVAGKYAPPFSPVHTLEKQKIIDKINQSGADILWVGLGSPKQDFWMKEHREHLDAPVIIGAGAAFDFLSGHKRQAPAWMRKAGLEWFFRLCSEPRRLWKRYLIGNTQFIFWLLREQLRKK